MLQLENIVVEQGGFQLCADFEIPTGAQVAIIGPSGAGKSTLLDLIAGFIEPVKGRVLWNGKNLAGLPPGARPVSILFQDNNIFPHLTVAQNVGLGLKPNLRLSPQQQEDVGKSLRRVGLEEMAQRSPASLSGGQRSRVALARILLQNRPVLALDEPFGALGPSLKREMLDLVQSLAAEQALTLLMVTHDPMDAKAITPQTVLVAEGRAQAPRDTAHLFANPPEALRAYLGP